jgi:hypothetical protein
MSTRAPIVSYRCVSLEPTTHVTDCEFCGNGDTENAAMYAVIVTRRAAQPRAMVFHPNWSIICLKCMNKIEAEARADNPTVTSGTRLTSTFVAAWGEEP